MKEKGKKNGDKRVNTSSLGGKGKVKQSKAGGGGFWSTILKSHSSITNSTPEKNSEGKKEIEKAKKTRRSLRPKGKVLAVFLLLAPFLFSSPLSSCNPKKEPFRAAPFSCCGCGPDALHRSPTRSSLKQRSRSGGVAFSRRRKRSGEARGRKREEDKEKKKSRRNGTGALNSVTCIVNRIRPKMDVHSSSSSPL